MLETSRFYIRKIKIEDAELAFKNWTSDDAVSKYLTWSTHKSVNDTIEWIKNDLEMNYKSYVIVDKNINEPVGSISVVKESPDYSYCEVGYCMAKNYWNKGCMSEILDAFMGYLFKNFNYSYIYARHDVNNIASGRVMSKCGMRQTHISSELTDKYGWCDVAHYLITIEEYKMKKLQKKMMEILHVDVPAFNNLNMLKNYLKNEAFSVSRVSLIDNNSIRLNKNDEIFYFLDKQDNVIQYTFVTNINKESLLNQYTKDFIEKNINYFITNNNKTIEQILVNKLTKHGLHISFGESCTGGMMASTIINVPGASNIIEESFVTYSERAKEKILAVDHLTLKEHSVYSKEVAKEMVEGVYAISRADVCVAITGRAGGEIRESADGSYDFAVIIVKDGKKYLHLEHKNENGSRNEVRKKQVNYCFFRIIQLLEKYYEN